MLTKTDYHLCNHATTIMQQTRYKDKGKLLKSAGHVRVKSPGHVNVDMSFLFFRSSQLDSSVSDNQVSAR